VNTKGLTGKYAAMAEGKHTEICLFPFLAL